jgi:hypothetical protein
MKAPAMMRRHPPHLKWSGNISRSEQALIYLAFVLMLLWLALGYFSFYPYALGGWVYGTSPGQRL